MSALDEIRGRRDAKAEQYLGVLEMCTGDTENKRSMLSIASRGLADAKVAARWIELAAAEEDTQLKAEMIGAVAGLDFRQVPIGAYVKLMLDGLMLDRVKHAAIAGLGRMIVGNEEAIRELIEAYGHQGRTGVQRHILAILLKHENCPAPLVQFLLTVVDRVDPDLKVVVIDRLMQKDALKGDALKKLLRPDEPSWVKLRAIEYVRDRALPMEAEIADVLRKDGHVDVRLAAVGALAARGKIKVAVDALLEALRKDPESRVREAVMVAFTYSLELSNESIAAILGALRAETDVARVRFLLKLLVPHLNRSFPVRDAFLSLLQENLKAELAVEIYEALGKLSTWDPALFEGLFVAYAGQKNDRVKAAILKALSGWHEADARLIQLYQEALKAPDGEIRTWGARGLLLLPMTEENCAVVASTADILLDKKIDWDVREGLAKKISMIPTYTPTTVAALKSVAEQGKDEIKTLATQAYDRGSKQTAEAGAIDWDLWYRRVEVEKKSEGIFPDIYIDYDQNPEMARKILKAALNPDVDLYNTYGYGVSAGSIVDFLVERNAVDDDVARYCLRWVLDKDSSYGSPNAMLAAFKSNPRFAELKTGLWQIFEKREAEPVLMREVLEAVYGADAAAEFKKRLLAKTTPASALNYFKFLVRNVAWEPVEPILLEALKATKLHDAETKKLLKEAFEKVGKKMPEAAAPPAQAGPGFADE